MMMMMIMIMRLWNGTMKKNTQAPESRDKGRAVTSRMTSIKIVCCEIGVLKRIRERDRKV